MKICVVGLWHLGSVVSASLASLGHEVTAVDDAAVVEALRKGRLPVHEPGLADLISQELSSGRLRYDTNVRAAVAWSEILWVTIDTPVDEDDRPNHEAVMVKTLACMTSMREGGVILISSQVPVGWTHELARRHEKSGGRRVKFAYSPENLRLGSGLETFRDAERFVVGVDDIAARVPLQSLFDSFAGEKLWMSVLSAEMTKHALNAFLALSITFINEIATLCESSGADVRQVERGLKSDRRIGPRAYLKAGGSFGGGTLARDLRVLGDLSRKCGVPPGVVAAVLGSNDRHKGWVLSRLARRYPDLRGIVVSVLGLAYKPGTDAVRRSPSVELCRALAERGALVRAYDPLISRFPEPTPTGVSLFSELEDALSGSDALVLATPSQAIVQGDPKTLLRLMRRSVVLDPNRLWESCASEVGVEYESVGFTNS